MKKILSVLIFIMFFFIFNLNVYADDIELKSKSAVLYNMTDDKVLYEKNADQEVGAVIKQHRPWGIKVIFGYLS